MSGIDLYKMFALAPVESGAVLARQMRHKLDSKELKDADPERKKLAGYAWIIFQDERKRRLYDRALQSPFEPAEVTNQFLQELVASSDTQQKFSLRNASLDAPRSAPAESSSASAVPNPASALQITKTYVPVRPLAPDASWKDVWARVPRTIQIVIGVLGALLVFDLWLRVSWLAEFRDLFLDVVLAAAYDLFSLAGPVVAACVVLVNGFSAPGRSRKLKIILLLVMAADLLVIATALALDAEAGRTNYAPLWGVLGFVTLLIVALIMCFLPQSRAWFRGMSLVKTESSLPMSGKA